MIVVSNTSPLHYFIAVEQAHVFAQLFGDVLVPPAVILELSHPSAPVEVREWISRCPEWLRRQPLADSLNPELVANLDQGEAEAIQLAEEQHADLLILDEWKGREIAQRRGLPVTGALGILGRAYQQKFIDDPLHVLAAMRERGFRIHEELAKRFELLLHNRYSR
jgi:predicted nucleic acid-binding protein